MLKLDKSRFDFLKTNFSKEEIKQYLSELEEQQVESFNTETIVEGLKMGRRDNSIISAAISMLSIKDQYIDTLENYIAATQFELRKIMDITSELTPPLLYIQARKIVLDILTGQTVPSLKRVKR